MFVNVSRMAEITSKQEKTIIALLSSASIKDAAATVGITEQTIHRWFKEDSFNAAYLIARREAYQQAIAYAQRKVSDAMQALCEVMKDGKGSERVSAAKAIMEFAKSGIEIDDHEQRLKEIEANSWSKMPNFERRLERAERLAGKPGACPSRNPLRVY